MATVFVVFIIKGHIVLFLKFLFAIGVVEQCDTNT